MYCKYLNISRFGIIYINKFLVRGNILTVGATSTARFTTCPITRVRRPKKWERIWKNSSLGETTHSSIPLRGSLAVVCSYAPGCEPLVTGNLAMGLTIRSSHKQELSSIYQFIDVLYSLCIYEALRHWSLSCPLLRVFSVLVVSSSLFFRTVLCRAIYTRLVAIRLATIGRRYYWSHTSGRSVRLYTGECVVDSSTGLWDRAVLLYPV